MISGETIKNRLMLAVTQVSAAAEQWDKLAGDPDFSAKLDNIADELRAAIKYRPSLIGETGNGEEAFVLGDNREGAGIQTE